jgi:ribosomal protein S18 acetylase RimI-like enzyme
MPESIQIRSAKPVDSEPLSLFAARVFPLGCPPHTRPADLEAFIATELTPQRFADYISQPCNRILIGEIAGRVVGYLMLVEASTHQLVTSLRPLEVRKLYVDPQLHGQGVAEALMRTAVTFFRGFDSVWLSVYSENARAIAFYKKWGFAIIGRQHFLVGVDPQEDFIMERKAQACEG